MADEKLLYSSGLNPSAVSGESTLYGVQLELDSIDRKIRTPKDILKEKTGLEKEIDGHKAKRADAWNAAMDQSDKQKQEYSRKIRTLREEKHAAEAENAMIPGQLSQLKAELLQTEEATKAWRMSELKKVEAALVEIASRKEAALAKKEEIVGEREKRMRDSLKKREARKKELDAKLQAEGEVIEEQLNSYRQETEQKLSSLKGQEAAELAGEGADVKAISDLEAVIVGLDKELSYIESHRPAYYEYLQNKREHLDKEEEVRGNKKTLQGKLDSLDERHQRTAEKHQALKEKNDGELQSVRRSLTQLRKGLDDAHNFMEDRKSCPTEVRDGREEKTTEDLPRILDKLKSFIYDRSNKREELRSRTNAFKGNFSAQNTFKFRTELSSDDDYMLFGSELSEFVENDKISTYSERVSRQYQDILQRISKEVGDLTSRSSEVSKTIGEINADFRERNFAGVIKDISLRWVSSEDRLMQLLVKIRDFTMEHSFGFGEMNLFCDGEDKKSISKQTINLLEALQKALRNEPDRKMLDLGDTLTFNSEWWRMIMIRVGQNVFLPWAPTERMSLSKRW